ncbi:MAG TPA: 50S ribosomal protein L25 [Vicinamibacterales bacterium]|nr:50S ribosomal protein L25 [Vicinamibacterales bacterium]
MEATLEVVSRNRFGRNEAGRIRREGLIPAVVYGEASEALPVSVDPKALLKILRSQSGANTLITLKVDGAAGAKVLVKEYQVHPVEAALLHADFYRVAMDKLLRVTVPVHLTGEAKGVKAEGGVVDFVHREVVLECLPGDIPEHITIDVSDLGLHDGIRVRDLPVGKWKALSDQDMLIVHVVTVKVVEEAPAATDAAAAPVAPAEPEVIKKGKIEKPEDEK